jgi:hypothetical protein
MRKEQTTMIQRVAAIVVLAVCLLTAGCQNEGGGGAGSGSGSGATKVPQDARRVAEATGSRLVHRTLREGTVYVQDGETGKVLYSGPVRSHANVVVDPAASAITVNDQQVKSAGKLQPGRTYRLYFKQR